MQELKDRIVKEGKVLPGNIISLSGRCRSPSHRG